MKRAQRFPCAARALERYVRLNEFNDVVCLADLFHQFRANEPTHKTSGIGAQPSSCRRRLDGLRVVLNDLLVDALVRTGRARGPE